MKLFLVRHGQTVTNATGCWTGWYDAPLTEQGREDAIRARGFLSDLSFDKVYSSDLSRARDTALLALPGCTPEQTPLLREINVGSYATQPFTILTRAPRPASLATSISVAKATTPSVRACANSSPSLRGAATKA